MGTYARMEWSKLLTKKRIDGNADFVDEGKERPPGKRSEFEKDYDRIVYSHSFRRLQNKTQVHTLTNNDHVRNRLTHSLEASTLARSLGLRIGQWLRDERNEPVSPDDIAACVQAATLAHDIGNPPFGHSGEEAIQRWFQKEDEAGQTVTLTRPQKKDFFDFNGNAQGFRVLARFRNGRKRPGLHLTCAVLSTFLKYPYTGEAKPPSGKLPGLFVDDAKLYRTIASELGIPKLAAVGDHWARHPLVYLLEAADDAAYLTADIEDGVELGLIPLETAKELFSEFLEPADKLEFSDDYSVLAKYRSKTIGKLLKIALSAFKDRYDAIMLGAQVPTLLDPKTDIRIKKLREAAKSFLFASSAQIRREFAGQQALIGLLKHFARTTCRFRDAGWSLECLREKDTSRDAWRLLRLTQGLGNDGDGALLGTGLPRSEHEMLHYITDFIAGQTDRYAVELWKNLRGIEL
jgi:dGTPase